MVLVKTITYFLSSGRKTTIKVNKKHAEVDTFKDDVIKNLANGYAHKIKKSNYQSDWGWTEECCMACIFNCENSEGYKYVKTYNMSEQMNINNGFS